MDRFRTIIFWVYDEPEILNKRLDARVNKMVEVGFSNRTALGLAE